MADRTIAHYNLLEPVGRDALGEIFRARDTKVGRTVALRIIEPALVSDETRRLALLDEARLASRLSHPNIATLFDIGDSDGVTFFAYEYAAGALMRSEMAGQPMLPRRAVEIAIQIADALAEGHSAGVVHGDLRPETIGVTSKGSAKVLDFGLSRWLRGGATRRAAGRAPDSLPPEDVPIVAYMSPEQALGGAADGRADLFSLGILLYEMLTGRNPFSGATVPETVMKIVKHSPVPPSSVASGGPPELDALVLRALSKDLEARFQSAASFSAELRNILSVLDDRAHQRPIDYVLPVDDAADRVPPAVWLTAAAGIVVVVALLWWLGVTT